MLTGPGMQLLASAGVTTVDCACGDTLFRLAPGEAVYPSGTLMRVMGITTNRKIGCKKCGAEYTIPVTSYPQSGA
jgi:hypothetical protein